MTLDNMNQWLNSLSDGIAQKLIPWLDSLSIPGETVILLLKVTGVAAGILAFLSAWRVYTLHSSLPAAKAAKLMRQYRIKVPVPEETVLAVLDTAEDQPEEHQIKEKRSLLAFTIPDDAQSLLDAITVQVSLDNGWRGSFANN